MNRLQSAFDIRSLNEDDGTFNGYGSVFGNVDSHRDIVAKGAFRESIAESKLSGKWPAMLLQHGMGPNTEDALPIGIWTSMHEDDHGLYLEGKLAGTQRGRDLYTLMKMQPRPALNGLSIGYHANQFVIHGRSDKARRTLQSVKLKEVSLVTDPSNSLATVRHVKFVSHGTDDAAKNFMRALASLEATIH
jgi:HK97 family phage prohead protease